MHLTNFEIILWYFTLLLDVLVCVLAFWRRLYVHLPLFTTYLTVLLAREAFMYWVYHSAGYTSRLAFYSFWMTQALLVIGRGASIGELGWVASRPYPGFRVVVKWVLSCIALVLLVFAAAIAITNISRLPPFILGLERDIDLTTTIVLVALFALSRRYRVSLESPQRLVAVGFFVYSLVQVLNNAISRQRLESYFHGWAIVWIVSFDAALVIWLLGLVRPLPPPPETPQPADLQAVREFMQQGTRVIRELSAHLSRFRKKL